MPTGRPPHLDPKNVTASEDRYLMTIIATASNSAFAVSRYEIEKEGLSYTVETMAHFAEMYPDTSLFFITGVDAVLEIETWETPGKIFNYGKIIAAKRPGYEIEKSATIAGYKTSEDSSEDVDIYIMGMPGVAVSSTEIRRRIRQGKPVRYLLPDKVLDYIKERKLYT